MIDANADATQIEESPQPGGSVQRPISGGAFMSSLLVDTTQGLMEIGQLRPGHMIITPSGPRTLRHMTPCTADQATLIRIRAGAFAPGQPGADIVTAGDQLVLVQDQVLTQGFLVGIGALVNGGTIQREQNPADISFFCLEFDEHELLQAHGLSLATFRPPGQKLAIRQLPPGPALFALRARLAGRVATVLSESAALSETRPTEPASSHRLAAPTSEPTWVDTAASPPAVRIVADGTVVPGTSDGSSRWTFLLPAHARWLRLASPSVVAAGDDGRRIGVAVLGLALDAIPLDIKGTVAADGFYAVEEADGLVWRWTDGFALIRLPQSRRPRRLDVTITDWHVSLMKS